MCPFEQTCANLLEVRDKTGDGSGVISLTRRFREDDVIVPQANRRHFAEYLSQQSTLPRDAILATMKGHQLLFGRRRSSMSPAARDVMGTSILERLPDELLCKVQEFLDPVDAVCLATTCCSLWVKLDYQLADIQLMRDLATSFGHSQPFVTDCPYRALERRFVAGCFEVTDRLDADRMNHLLLIENDEEVNAWTSDKISSLLAGHVATCMQFLSFRETKSIQKTLQAACVAQPRGPWRYANTGARISSRYVLRVEVD